MHSLTSVGCGLAVAGQTQTFKRFLLALGHTYIRTAVACSSAVQQQPLAALLHICTFLIPSKAQSLPFISAFHHDTSLLFVIVMLCYMSMACSAQCEWVLGCGYSVGSELSYTTSWCIVCVSAP
jgi:hypothetical protein